MTIAVTSLVGGLLVVSGPASAEVVCTDYVFAGARGTGSAYLPTQLGMGPEVFEIFDDLTDPGDDESYVLSNGKTIKAVGLEYEASTDLVWSALQVRETDGYAESVHEAGEMIHDIYLDTLAACSSTEFILAGYSQGADAIARGIYTIDNFITPAAIAVTVLLGDTRFNGTDRVANRGSYSPRYSGIVGARPRSRRPLRRGHRGSGPRPTDHSL